jgi:hypothetical protein
MLSVIAGGLRATRLTQERPEDSAAQARQVCEVIEYVNRRLRSGITHV